MKEHFLPSIRIYLVLTLLLGFAYPAVVWGVGRIAFRGQADGEILRKGERVVGSSLIGQSFTSPRHFHSRPSAAGETGYDPTASGGTNLGPTSKKLAETVRNAVAALRARNLTPGDGVPADAVTSSASGLDPHVSPEFARWQVARISRETGLSAADLEALVAARTEGRFLGVFGERRVNVLLLNLDLQRRLEAGGQPAR
jgi:K+-transporting ATPase ATPase C chain